MKMIKVDIEKKCTRRILYIHILKIQCQFDDRSKNGWDKKQTNVGYIEEGFVLNWGAMRF